ncbi:SPERT protein, partial [Halcyon senegalensis]|nr:SPERT protein [Halcyon senegalensis]
TMSAFDLTNQSMQCTEPEIDYIAPRTKLKDEVFVFVDGKWVSEIYCQPPFASHRKFFSKKAQNEWSIWEENRALWHENQVLRLENRMLWEENKALQRLQSQNETVHAVYTDAIQQSLPKENKPFPFFQERNTGFQVSPGNKVLRAVQEKYRVLEDFHKENETGPIIWKDQKAITVHEESQDVSSGLQKDTDTITAVEEDNPGPALQQEYEAEKNSIPTQNKIKSAPCTPGEHEILQALQDLYKFLHNFLEANHLLGEKQGCHILCDVNRSFQEEYNKLKLHLNAMKNTVSDIKSQMEVLEMELIAIASPAYEEEEEKVANEYLLGEM